MGLSLGMVNRKKNSFDMIKDGWNSLSMGIWVSMSILAFRWLSHHMTSSDTKGVIKASKI